MWQYHITIYEKNSTSTVSIESLAETFKVDEALDSAVLVIPRSTRKEQYKRFSPVKIEVSDGTNSRTTYWLIYTPKTELSAKGTTPLFDHTLGLIEPTKWLEKFPVGTLTFTQPLGGTRYTMAGVVDRIRLLAPFVEHSKTLTTRLFTVDSTFNTYLSLIKAPQFYLDKKNLREAMIQTFKYINAIPRLAYDGTNWTQTADFINKRQLPINIEDNIIDYGDESSGEDYGLRAEVYHENTITNEEQTANVRTNSIVDVISFRTDTGIIMGDDSYKLILTNKIERLISFKALLFAPTDNGIDEFEWNGQYIFEKKVYDTFDINTGTNQKQYSVYWTYGTNVIEGFSETFGAFNIDIALRNIIRDKYPLPLVNIEYSIVTFRVEYIPYVEQMRSEQYREDKSTHELPTSMREEYSTIQVNPQERINSLYDLTGNVYGQVQRLGVDTVAISKKHKTVANYNGSNDGIFNLGDYTEDGFYVVIRELVYFNGFIIGRYELSRNFNRIAQFIQIDKEFRPYEITLTKSDFTLRRNVMIPFFTVEVSNESNANHINNSLITPFMKTFVKENGKVAISGANIKIGASPETMFVESVFMPVIATAEKNTLKFKVDFNDTKLAGRRLTYLQKTSLLFLREQKQVYYTDQDGFIEFIQIDLHTKYWNYLHDGLIHPATTPPSGDQRETAYTLHAVANEVPFVDSRDTVVIQVSNEKDDPMVRVPSSNFFNTVAQMEASTGVYEEYYYVAETMRVYQYFGTFEILANAIALREEPIYQIPSYKILKDQSEVLSLEMYMPIVPHKDLINQYILGDLLTKKNGLIANPSVDNEYYWYVQDAFFSKAETKNIGQTSGTSISTTITITGNYITVPTAVLNTNKNFALATASGELWIAVNRKNFDGTTKASNLVDRIYFNFLKERS